VANAGQRKGVVADTAYHVFRLPQIPPGYAGARMERVQPTKADDVSGQWWRNMPGLIGLPEHEAERWRQGSEFRGGHEGKIDLQSAGQEKYAVNPCAGLDVKMMNSEVLGIHMCRPIGEDIRQLGGIDNAESEIDVRPPVFAFGCRRTSDGSTANAPVACGVVDEVGAQSGALFRSKH
jgi:hypothetical protein